MANAAAADSSMLWAKSSPPKAQRLAALPDAVPLAGYLKRPIRCRSALRRFRPLDPRCFDAL